jgi:hypothetical protein
MEFPLSLSDISLWIAVTAIIRLVTSELLSPYSEQFGDFVIEKKRLRVVALCLGLTFVATVLIRVITPF